jgi:hypothetical protein
VIFGNRRAVEEHREDGWIAVVKASDGRFERTPAHAIVSAGPA